MSLVTFHHWNLKIVKLFRNRLSGTHLLRICNTILEYYKRRSSRSIQHIDYIHCSCVPRLRETWTLKRGRVDHRDICALVHLCVFVWTQCAFTSIHYCVIVSWCSPPPRNINYQMMKPPLWSEEVEAEGGNGGHACRRPSLLMGLTLILSVCVCVCGAVKGGGVTGMGDSIGCVEE